MLNIKNMDEVMSNKNYTMVIDGKSPAGMIKFRYEPTQEIVYVVVNETLAENTLKVMAVHANATVDHASENKEDNTMAQNNNTQATTNNTSKKEEKKMTLKERWMANLKNGEELGYKAARKTGYAVGYATTTVKEEVAYAARKVTKGISETRVAKEVRNGYYDGKNDARTAFDCRVSEREYKAEQKNAKNNLKAAVDELMDEFEDFDDSVCGDGVWNAQ